MGAAALLLGGTTESGAEPAAEPDAASATLADAAFEGGLESPAASARCASAVAQPPSKSGVNAPSETPIPVPTLASSLFPRWWRLSPPG